MHNIIETVYIPMTPTALWDEIGAFGAIGDWHPMLERVESEGDRAGATRAARAADGSTQVERLQAFDATRHVYRYSLESTPMPVRDYTGEFRVDGNDDRSSTVTWSVQFDLTPEGNEAIVEMIRGFLKTGTDNLKRRYGEVE